MISALPIPGKFLSPTHDTFQSNFIKVNYQFNTRNKFMLLIKYLRHIVEQAVCTLIYTL